MIAQLVKGEVSKLFGQTRTDSPVADTPKYAYDLEDQMFGVMKSQSQGLLISRNWRIESIDLITENGQGWYLLNGYAHFEGHCSEYMRELEIGDIIISIHGEDARPDIFNNQDFQCVGLILDSRARILYKSPGFNFPELTPE